MAEKNRNIWGFLTLAVFVLMAADSKAEDVIETEMFSIAISPKMFNWTYQEFDRQYTFHASIINKPDLPDWLHYIYSVRHHSGFIYGTPPYNQKDMMIQIIALNREDYETRRLVIPLHILKKEHIATYQVQLKIDNLNVEDLLDNYRMERLKDIFKKKLWKEGVEDLHATFLASAVDLGARLPLKPNEGEGVVLKLGSRHAYSGELQQLQTEVRPLARLASCPRDFKRTSVERLFRDANFNLDWCTFRLIEVLNPAVEIADRKKMLKEQNDQKSNLVNRDHHAVPSLYGETHRWLPPTKLQVPQRSYVHEFTFTFIMPMLVMIILVSVLSLILCFHHEGISARNLTEGDSKVELSHYHSDASAATVANTGSAANLQAFLGDNVSSKSGAGASPNNSISKPRVNPNMEVDYNRPQPPPYLGSNTNSLVLRHRQNLEEDLATKRNQARTLEESLQMLNEANISNRAFTNDHIFPERIILGSDMLLNENLAANAIDEDYVPIKDYELSLRRKNGKVNGAANGGLMRNVEDF